MDSFGSEQGHVAGFCGHANELSGSIKWEEFLAELGYL